jgi:thioredoxin-related protein
MIRKKTEFSKHSHVLLFLFFCFLFNVKVAFAQGPDFSGTWALLQRISLSGKDYANGLPKQLKVSQKQDSVTFERLNVYENNEEITTREALSFNGSSTVTMSPVSNKKRVAFIKWSSDMKSLTEQIYLKASTEENKSDIKITEVWTLSDDGKMLTVVKVSENDKGEKWSMKGVYVQSGFGEGISFEQASSWNELVAKAKLDNKYIFVDCYASWCKPCKEMEQFVYPMDIVSDYMNKNFISLKLQMDTTKRDKENVQRWYGIASLFQTKYKVNAYPFYLFFSPSGNIIHADVGYKNPADFISMVKTLKDYTKQYYTLLNNYQQGKKDFTKMAFLALTAKKLGDENLAISIANDYKGSYLDTLNDVDLCKREIIELARSFPQLIYNDGSKGRFFNLFYRY